MTIARRERAAGPPESPSSEETCPGKKRSRGLHLPGPGEPLTAAFAHRARSQSFQAGRSRRHRLTQLHPIFQLRKLGPGEESDPESHGLSVSLLVLGSSCLRSSPSWDFSPPQQIQSSAGVDTFAEGGARHTKHGSTYVTQMQCVEAGSGEIRMVGDRGVPVQGFRIPQPVQALWGRQAAVNAEQAGGRGYG